MDSVNEKAVNAAGVLPTRVEVLKHHVQATRQEITDCALELDRRRREALDLTLQARRHPATAAAVAIGLAAGVAGAAFLAARAVRKRLHRRTLSGRLTESICPSGLHRAAYSKEAKDVGKSIIQLPIFAAAARVFSESALSTLAPIALFAARRMAAAIGSAPRLRRR